METFHLEMRLRNNRIRARRLALGLTGAELGRQCGISASRISAIENMRTSPIVGDRRGGKVWSKTTRALAKFFKCNEAELFPAAVFLVVNSTVSAEVSEDQVLALTTFAHGTRLPPEPDQRLVDIEQLGQLDAALDSLSPREQKIIRERFFEDRTLLQVGEDLGVSRERARQLELRSIEKLRKRVAEQESA